MTAINFGVGTIIGRRTDIATPTPVLLGIAQDIQIDMDKTLKELIGQQQMPVDIAQAAMKVSGKAKFARMSANGMNDLFLGQTITPASGEQVAVNEAHNGAATVTVTQSGTYAHDLGVFYAATGVQLARVAPASEATGKYSVVETTGIYTFGGTDVSGTPALLFTYRYTVTSMIQITMANQLMGSGPSFELNLQEKYTSNAGVVNTLFLRLNACKGSKFSLPFKNVDYTIMDFDFQAFADQAGNWGEFSFIE